MCARKSDETIEGTTEETTTAGVIEKSIAEANIENQIEDDFELLSSYTNDNYTRITKVLNIYGGCIVNTIVKNETGIAVTSLFIPGNHLRDGKIGPM